MALEGGVKIKRPLYALAPLVLLSALRTAGSLLRSGELDLVHVHWVVPNGPIGAIAARRHDLPLVVTLHGSDMAVSERSRPIGRATRWTFARTAAVTAPSGDLLERARRLGAPGLRELIPYGADARSLEADPREVERLRGRLGLGPADVVVAGLGRLIPVKGFEYLLEAHAKARIARPELRLVLVGDGDLREELRARARALGVADSLILAGMVDRGAIPAYLGVADIVVVPSVRYGGYVDGLPNVALEAMAAGKPLVATRVGGLPELVRHGETGLLVDEKDSDALADAIVTLARDGDMRTRMGDSSRRLVRETMSWDSVAERYEAVYERVARGQIPRV
jgi:glycosyltransferase involved in cell wall biosynthesis